MRGDHCRRALFTALTPVAGIQSADVSLGSITIEHDGSLIDADVRDAIAVTGYVVSSVIHERGLPIFGAGATT